MDPITQADEGCGFRCLTGTQPTPEPEIFRIYSGRMACSLSSECCASQRRARHLLTW